MLNDKVVLYVLQKQSQNIKKCFRHKTRFLDVSVKYTSTSKLALLLFATVLPKHSPLWLCCGTHRGSLQGHCRRPLHGPLAVVAVVKKAPPPACSDRLNDIMMGHRQLCTAVRHCHRFSRRLIGWRDKPPSWTPDKYTACNILSGTPASGASLDVLTHFVHGGVHCRDLLHGCLQGIPASSYFHANSKH